jgi:hypothetical protein
MRLRENNRRHAAHVAKLIAADKSGDTDTLTGIWNWINGVANGVSDELGDTILSGFKTVLQHLQNLVSVVENYYKAISRIIFWVDILVYHIVKGWIDRERKQRIASDSALKRYLIGLIYITTQYVLVTCMRAINAERKHRERAVGSAEARAKREVKALHGVIEREAASAYRVTNDARASLIVKLLDFAADRAPEIKAITKDIAGGILDLLEVDDPILRLGLGFLIKQVIDRLGIDKGVGALISDLIDPIIGDHKPTDLHGVVLDMTKRIGALEGQFATFFQDGGAQVEQAGDDWKNITSIEGQTAIAAFTTQAVLAPATWAAEIADTVGAAANALADAAATLFGA